MSAPEEHIHMSWCQGQHEDWDCVLTTVVNGEDGYGDLVTATLYGVHCDSARLDINGSIYEPGHLDLITATLEPYRQLLETSRVDADCDLHPHLHPEPADDEDDVTGCAGCGDATVSLSEVDGEWLCRACCEARNVVYPGLM